MSCPHDWQPVRAGSRVFVCMRCAGVSFDKSPAVHISPLQATALGFERNAVGLLQVNFDTRARRDRHDDFTGPQP